MMRIIKNLLQKANSKMFIKSNYSQQKQKVGIGL
jgi:hypothetical protein